MPKISAVIITFNEERNIERCLLSLISIADEILVVDSFSTDKTEEICAKYNVRFIKHKFDGYIEQKNYATSQATYDYVLALDADEALSEQLKQAIKKIKENLEFDGYRFPRLTNYCGKWIKHTSWYPSKKLRLWDRRKGSWGGVNPHDKFIMVKGSRIKNIKGDLLHYSFYSINEQILQINKFSDILAKSYYQRGKTSNYWHIIFHPIWRFTRDYFFKFGFLDGFYGLIVSMNSTFEVFLKYVKLKQYIALERQKEQTRVCFFTSSVDLENDEEWMLYNTKKLNDKGIELRPGFRAVTIISKGARRTIF
jgi:glycosyltransferase involved in cell wall biosynthesis